MAFTHSHRAPGGVADQEIVEDRPAPLARLGQLMIVVGGAYLLLSGAFTLARTGLHGDLSQPVVSVFGYTHSPWLGIAEVVAGILVLSGAVWWDREPAVVFGALLVIIGIVLLASPTSAPTDLAIADGYGWVPLLCGALALVGGLLPGGWTRSRRVVRQVRD